MAAAASAALLSGNAARPALHAPKLPYDEFTADSRLLKKASRLNKVADAVASLDLKAIASTYQKESGGSGLQAAAIAAEALNAALKSSLQGDPATAKQLAEKEAASLARKKAREAKTEAWRAEAAQDESKQAQASRAQAHVAVQQRGERAAASKEERLADSAAIRRAQREERMAAAAAQRTLSEARARFGGRPAPAYQDEGKGGWDGSGNLPRETSDPMLRKAQGLCLGARRVIAQLDEQNQFLQKKAEALPAPPRPVPSQAAQVAPKVRSHSSTPKAAAPRSSAKKVGATAHDEALLAKAKELLADYDPPELRRRPPVPSGQSRARTPARTPTSPTSPAGVSGMDADGAAKLERAKMLCASVSVELDKQRNRR
eukprot:TRINITY_DN3430_c0_g5_i1.p1 TRINITY_DN3430_c0_g5~~TRINITY_DN3430_c0_g5_i1.p1  ORF type:complete len:389 (-),score=127.29 TRINITY_DN3430_c0_g5_i1:93-1214(-)